MHSLEAVIMSNRSVGASSFPREVILEAGLRFSGLRNRHLHHCYDMYHHRITISSGIAFPKLLFKEALSKIAESHT